MIRILIETYGDNEIDDLDTDKQMIITDDNNKIIIGNNYSAYAYAKDDIKKITIEIE
jgi:hypothetical protein